MKKTWRWSVLAAVLLAAALLLCALSPAGAEDAPGMVYEPEPVEMTGGLAPVPELVCLPDVLETPARPMKTLPPDYPGAVDAIIQAAVNYEEYVDLTAYRIPAADIGALYIHTKNRSGRLFHLDGAGYSRYQDGTVARLVFAGEGRYIMTASEYAQAKTFYDAELQNILDQIPAGLSDLEKVLFLHDYVATHYRYDVEGLASGSAIYDVYQMFKEGKGVCQAYTLLMEDLLDLLGIPVSYCQSNALNHIWNLVELDGRWYHLDVTHDDPTYSVSGLSLGQDMLGGAVYKYFLITDDTCKTNRNNSGADWVYGEDVTCTDARYETAVFSDADSPFAYDAAAKTWYFMDTDSATRGLYRWDKSGGLTASTRMNADLGGWYGYRTSLACYDGALYYCDPGTIYRWDPTTQTTDKLYTYSGGTAYVWGAVIRDGKMYYQRHTDAAIVEYGRFALERSGAGTQASPYLITDQAELEAFRDLVGSGSFTVCGKLTEDIVYQGAWSSIAPMSAYKGTFDGDGHVIATLSKPLFGANSGTVERVGVFGSGVCATNNGTVRNCLAYGSATDPLVRTNNAAGRVEHCYANGAGKLCATNNGTVTNAYYIGAPGEPGTGLPTAAFTSGEVTWRLQNGQGAGAELLWSQKLTGSVQQYPTMDGQESGRVRKVTFATRDNADYAARYCNTGGTVTLPTAPVSGSFQFTRWATAADGTGSFSASSRVTGDMTVYVVGREKYGQTDADTALTLTYDPANPQSVDLTGYAGYAAGSADSFQYALKSQTGGLGATVSAAGTLTVPAGTAAGDYTVTVTVSEDAPIYRPFAVKSPGVQPFDLTLSLTVQPRTVTAAVTVAEGEYVYTGSAITPAVTVKDGQTVIDPGEYTVRYENNVSAGTATVTVTNQSGGNYVVSGSAAFTIQPKTVTATVTAGQEVYFHTGQAIIPAVTVKDGQTVIDPGEYTVSYEDNVDVGTATVTITDKPGGNFAVTGSTSFIIVRQAWLGAPEIDDEAGAVTAPMVCAPSLVGRKGVAVAALYGEGGAFLGVLAGVEVDLAGDRVTLTGTLPDGCVSCRLFLLQDKTMAPLADLP